MTRRHMPGEQPADGLTPEQRYLQEKERAMSQGKKVLGSPGLMTKQQLDEAKALLKAQEDRISDQRKGGRPRKQVTEDE